MKKIVLTALLILILLQAGGGIAWSQLDDGVDVVKENTLSKNAEAPEKVYARYCRAVHSGDVGAIKNLVYSRALPLWNNNSRQMLAMTKNSVPPVPRMISRRDKQEFQYNYTEMSMTGSMPDGKSVNGNVTMIVEKGQWKVYEEKWRQGI